jgi:hypothetical protein
MYGDNPNNRILGTCPICQHVIRLAFGDKVHKVGYCSGCGLEYGNPGQARYGIPKKVITDVEVQRMINEAYGQLIQHHPRLKVQIIINAIDKVSIRMTGYGCPSVPVWKLRKWGYDVVAGYIIRMEREES